MVHGGATRGAPLRALLDPRAPRGPFGAEYLPLRDLSYALDARLFGERAPDGGRRLGRAAEVGFRASNLAWYALACALCAAFCERVVDPARRGGRARALALAAAALFALHPAHAESVAWVSGRKDVLSGALVFAALLAHLRARERGSAPAYAASAALTAVACLAKSTAVAVPALVLALELALPAPPGRPSAPLRRRLLRVLPTLGVALAASALAVWVGGRTGVGRAHGSLELVLRLPEVALIDLPILRRYLVTAFAPLVLRINHHDLLVRALAPGPARWLDAALAAATLLPLALLAARTRRRLPRLAALWFLAALLPVLNLVPFSQWLADRFLFLPLLGPCLLLAAGGVALARRHRAAAAALGLGVGLLFGARALERGLDFADSRRLWEAQLAVVPGDPLAQEHLADALSAEAERAPAAEAAALRERAATLLAAAIEGFEASAVRNPGHLLQSHLLLAQAHAARGERAQAEEALARAAARFPDRPEPAATAGDLAARFGDLPAATTAYLEALRRLEGTRALAPEEHASQRQRARHNLAVLASRLGAAPEATAADLGLAARALARAGHPRAADEVVTRLAAEDPAAAARLRRELQSPP